MVGFSSSRDGITAVLGTILMVAVLMAISVAAWLLFADAADQAIQEDQILIGFETDPDTRSVTVLQAYRPLVWGQDILVLEDCTITLNGGTVSGPLMAGDVLACSGPGEVRITTSAELGNQMIYQTAFD